MKNDNAIKILSLGVGLAVGVVLIAKVFFELSYDSFYKDIDRVYSIRTWYSMNGVEKDYGQVSGAVAVGFMEEVPGVEAGTRTTPVFDQDVYLDEEGNKLTGSLVCTDTCFFKVFDRPVLAGDPAKALNKWGCVMVGRRFADKLVSGGDYSSVIGRQISNESMPGLNLTIEGVFEDFPENGSFDYDILLSITTYAKQSTENWMGNDRYRGYVRLAPGVDPNGLKDAVRKMQEAHQPLKEIEEKGTTLKYFLAPFSTIHTSSPEVKSQVVLLSIVAFLLIIISLLNYILIVISSMVKRSKEVGVRKCYGAEANDIYLMFSREATLHLALSLVLAGLIIFAGHGFVENLLGVPFSTLLVPQSIIAIIVVTAIVLAVSIVVPAELYQRIPIYAALKNYTENSRRWKLGLLGVQIVINVFLVIMMLVIGRQYDKVSHSDPGYDYENLYVYDLYGGDRYSQSRAVAALESVPEVSVVAASYNLPYEGSNGNNIMLPEESNRELFNIADQCEVSDSFYELMDIRFVEGWAPRDSSEIVVDEKFVARMAEFTNWSDGAVGKYILITGHGVTDDVPFRISGVYKSYLIGNLKDVDIRPSALFYGEIGSEKYWMPHILFKVSPGALNKVQDALSGTLDGKEVNIVSYEESMREAYAESKKMRNTMALGAVFSLLIALLGLIGFIKDESLRRSKEMAIRKINGATIRDILGVFVRDILKLSLSAALISSLAAWFAAAKWLEQFAERISLNPVYFIGGSLIVILIVIGVVVINCLNIAGANPVDSLKNE